MARARAPRNPATVLHNTTPYTLAHSTKNPDRNTNALMLCPVPRKLSLSYLLLDPAPGAAANAVKLPRLGHLDFCDQRRRHAHEAAPVPDGDPGEVAPQEGACARDADVELAVYRSRPPSFLISHLLLVTSQPVTPTRVPPRSVIE